MLIDEATADSFEKGAAAGVRLSELFSAGDLDDPAVAAEIVRLSESMRATTAIALPSAHATLAAARRQPLVRRTLEAMGLTREEVRRLADAFLALYDDTPGG